MKTSLFLFAARGEREEGGIIGGMEGERGAGEEKTCKQGAKRRGQS